MGAIGDSTPGQKNAAPEDLLLYGQAREQIKALDTSDTFDAGNPNHRLLVVSFDGTRNDRENPTHITQTPTYWKAW